MSILRKYVLSGAMAPSMRFDCFRYEVGGGGGSDQAPPRECGVFYGTRSHTERLNPAVLQRLCNMVRSRHDGCRLPEGAGAEIVMAITRMGSQEKI